MIRASKAYIVNNELLVLNKYTQKDNSIQQSNIIIGNIKLWS
jgi:hypothetical protein